MARRGDSGGSSLVLILFLVFFILLSIGLGVSTYLGFAQDDSKGKKVDELTKANKAMEGERDWYRFQSDLYRTYMGHTQNLNWDTFASSRDSYNVGKLTGPGGEDVKAITALLDQKLNWNAAQKRPGRSYEQLLDAETRKSQDAERSAQAMQAAAAQAKTAVKESQDLLVKANEAHDKEFKEFKDRANDELNKYLAENNKLKEQMKADTLKFETLAKGQDDDRRRVEKLLKDKDKLIADLREDIRRKDSSIALLRKETGEDIVVDLKKDWKIVRIDPRAETAYINLGSADGVQPQLTFRIHGIGPDGRPLPKDKATAQVIKVIDDHLSQAKIMYDTSTQDKDGKPRAPRHDPRTNPVLTGDVLFNPAWMPNQKKHIALAGVVDLTGIGRDDTEQFIRYLERQNVVVDAYVDMHKDFTIKGPGITVQTDFLILGDKPESILGAQGREKEIAEKIDAATKTMEKQAKENGVKKMSLHQFMNEIGFQVPPNADQKRSTTDYRGEAADLPPQAPKNPAPAPKPAAPDK